MMAKKITRKPTTENRNSICPFDYHELVKSDTIRAKLGNFIMYVPVYCCSACDRKYTSIKNINDLALVRIQENRLINLNLPYGRIRNKLEDPDHKPEPVKTAPMKTARVLKGEQLSSENASGFVTFRNINEESECLDPYCKGTLKRAAAYVYDSRNKPVYVKAKKCLSCGKYCVPIKEYCKNPQMMKCINDDDIIRCGKEMLKARGEDFLSIAERMYESRSKMLSFCCNVILANDEYLLQMDEKNKEEFKKIQKRSEVLRIEHRDNEIRVKDFLIKRNVFKCIHSDHILEDINATVSVVTNKGDLEPVHVSAGYCRNCNVYFVLEEPLKKLLSKGRPMCFLYDWDKKEKELHPGYVFMSAESLLHQYGYNVNAIDNIPTAKRQRILDTMIDNGVMTKNEILSYLNLFITQRQNNKFMHEAIGKWQEDIEHLLQYKASGNDSVQIRSFYRKT